MGELSYVKNVNRSHQGHPIPAAETQVYKNKDKFVRKPENRLKSRKTSGQSFYSCGNSVEGVLDSKNWV